MYIYIYLMKAEEIDSNKPNIWKSEGYQQLTKCHSIQVEWTDRM